MRKIVRSFIEKYRISIEIIKSKGIIAFVKAFILFCKRLLGLKKNQLFHNSDPVTVLLNQQKSKFPDMKQTLSEISEFHFKPKFLIIIEINDLNVKNINRTIDSFNNQYYIDFSVLLWGQLSKVNTILRKLVTSKRNRFSILNYINKDFDNVVDKIRSFEFFTIVTSGDMIEPISIYYFAKQINQDKNIELIYSDEAFVSEDNQVSGPLLKPDFSPHFLLSLNYIHRITAYSGSLLSKIETYFRPQNIKQLEIALNLTCFYSVERIVHIPHIFYYNFVPNLANFEDLLDTYFEDQKLMLERFAQFENAIIKIGADKNDFYFSKKITQREPLISIIIPFKDKVDFLKKCLNSIFSLTSYNNYEILLVSNNSNEQKTFSYLDSFKTNDKVRIFEENIPFNYSKINNNAVKKTNGKYIIFLNNDTEIISSNWIQEMLGQILFRNVGIVGAKLLYKNNLIQHAGVVTGFGGCADHILLETPDKERGYMNRASVVNNYSAVTAACLMIEKKLFNEVGGFDEEALKVAFNDVDLCLKVRELGLSIVYNPFVKLYHYESISRGKIYNQAEMKRHLKEVEIIKNRWDTDKKEDPFYHPLLSLGKKDYSFRI